MRRRFCCILFPFSLGTERFAGGFGKFTGSCEIQVTKRYGSSVARAKESRMQNPRSSAVSNGPSTFLKRGVAFKTEYTNP